jgi:DNA-binding transcriptional ArsR family regulator
MKPSYNIGAKNGLLEQKHFDKLGTALWLYLWFLDKQPKDTDKVLGGQPITYEMFALEFGKVSRRTYTYWLKAIVDGGYVTTLRTPRGSVVTINKPKKWSDAQKVAQQKSDAQDVAQRKHSDAQKMTHQNVSDAQDLSRDAQTFAHVEDAQDSAQAIKTNSLDKQKQSNSFVKSASPTAREHNRKILFFELVKALGFTDQVKATEGRLRKLTVRLKTYSPAEMMKAATALGQDQYMQGDNDVGKRWGNIDYLLRSDEMVDKWLLADQEQQQTTGKDLSTYA